MRQLLRHGRAGNRRHVGRSDDDEKTQGHGRGDDGGRQRIDDGVGKDSACFAARSQRRQRGDHGERDDGHGYKLEEAREHGGDEAKELIDGLAAEAAEPGADEHGSEPDHDPAQIFMFCTVVQ